MGKLQDFLMGNEIEEATKEVMINGFPEPFVIHSITEAENKRLRKASEIRYFDKKTHRQEKETDNDAYNTKLIVACCTDPNFKDAEWQQKKGVRGAEALVELILKSGDYNELLSEVLEINGFYDNNINDLREEAKN